jgi:hypothetical protein
MKVICINPAISAAIVAMISSLFGSSLIELKAFKYDSGSGVPNLSRFDPKGSSDSICTIVETSSIVALRNNKYFFVILFFFLVFAIQRFRIGQNYFDQAGNLTEIDIVFPVWFIRLVMFQLFKFPIGCSEPLNNVET